MYTRCGGAVSRAAHREKVGGHTEAPHLTWSLRGGDRRQSEAGDDLADDAAGGRLGEHLVADVHLAVFEDDVTAPGAVSQGGGEVMGVHDGGADGGVTVGLSQTCPDHGGVEGSGGEVTEDGEATVDGNAFEDAVAERGVDVIPILEVVGDLHTIGGPGAEVIGIVFDVDAEDAGVGGCDGVAVSDEVGVAGAFDLNGEDPVTYVESAVVADDVGNGEGGGTGGELCNGLGEVVVLPEPAEAGPLLDVIIGDPDTGGGMVGPCEAPDIGAGGGTRQGGCRRPAARCVRARGRCRRRAGPSRVP